MDTLYASTVTVPPSVDDDDIPDTVLSDEQASLLIDALYAYRDAVWAYERANAPEPVDGGGC